MVIITIIVIVIVVAIITILVITVIKILNLRGSFPVLHGAAPGASRSWPVSMSSSLACQKDFGLGARGLGVGFKVYACLGLGFRALG